MVQKIRIVLLVLALLIAPCFANSIEILISNETIETKQDYNLNFQTDINAFCYFISGSNNLYELVNQDSIFFDEESDFYLGFESSEMPEKSHQIFIELEECKESTQNNCFGDIFCHDEAYFDISEELIYDEDIIDQHFALKHIIFIEQLVEQKPLDSPTPVISPTPITTPTISASPTPTPTVSPSPEDNAVSETTQPCVPNCTNKICGDNGCGGICGYCSENEQCYLGQCIKYGTDDKEHEQNIIGANFNNNSVINLYDELLFQTIELSTCFFYYDNEPIGLESSDGKLHILPKNYLTIGDNNLSISCVTNEDSIEETKSYFFKINNSTNENGKKTNMSLIILIALIIATVFTISTLLIVTFLISPKKNNEKKQLIAPVNFQNDGSTFVQPNIEKPMTNKKIRSFPKKHLDYIFDQFQTDSTDSFDKMKLKKATSQFDREKELEQYENSLYIDLSNKLTKNKPDENNIVQTEKSNSQDESAKTKNDPTKELASIMLNEQLTNDDPLATEDIIDVIRNLGFKNSDEISTFFSKLLSRNKAKKEQLLSIIQDMRKLNVIDEMQALEILSKSNLLN